MRPQCLFPLFAPITTLPGIGPRLAPLFQRLVGGRVVDLLWHRPSGIVDRRFSPKIVDAPAGRIATLLVRIEAHLPPDTPRRPYRVRCSDETGFLHLIYFHAKEDWLRRQLPTGEQRIVSGLVERFNETPQITHPDHVVAPADRETIQAIEPVYPLTAGLFAKQVGKAVQAALAQVPDLTEWQDGAWLRRQNWPGWKTALFAIHHPTAADVLDDSPARRRLAYDELLANQLALILVRAQMRRLKGRSLQSPGLLRAQALSALPFALTAAQRRALDEVDADMRAPYRMLRLLQGDVGSGKTMVGFLAMLTVVEAGCQAALMAPTEILAQQHFATLRPLAEGLGLRIALLTGRGKGKAREALLAATAAGNMDILIGTHALFQQDVTFRDLAFVVIDEQHRFGVQQRMDLTGKGQAVDVLAMTATPIPRTLLLTAYGDMDWSRLDERPPGRQPIETRALPLARMDEIVAGLRRALADGARVYWVCPLIEETPDTDLAAAEARHSHLAEIFGEMVGLIHGRMKAADKDRAMAAFADGTISILVATTVVEVGMDVPEATIMVIEHAERFGLAQLHQLRGRVGRGERASTCLLLYDSPLSETARQRLDVMRNTDDGFVIAEEDLRLRGGGEILGTRQSGTPEFKIADLARDADLLDVCRDDARLALERDKDLSSARGTALRTLLYLFERDAAARTLRA